MKKSYVVGVREVHVRHYSVQAENEEEAKDLVYQQAESAADMSFEEYSHCLDRETWSVEEVPDKDGSPGQHREGAQP
jgi:hypothetical protein